MALIYFNQVTDDAEVVTTAFNPDYLVSVSKHETHGDTCSSVCIVKSTVVVDLPTQFCIVPVTDSVESLVSTVNLMESGGRL